MGDFLINKEIWEEYKFKNYISDITPGTRYTTNPRFIILEFFNVYGLFRADAWNRYFFNEDQYDQYSE
jgi:hypothetical protein